MANDLLLCCIPSLVVLFKMLLLAFACFSYKKALLNFLRKVHRVDIESYFYFMCFSCQNEMIL